MAQTQNSLPVGDWLIGSIRTSSVTVGTTPTLLPAVALVNRRLIILYNNSGATIYWGGSTVTIGNGIPLANSASVSLNLDASVGLYAIEATGGRNVRVAEGS